MPQSYPGKMLAMAWTLVGICVVSLFTAFITNMLSELLGGTATEATVRDSRIGVLAGSIERHLVMKQGGQPFGKSQLEKWCFTFQIRSFFPVWVICAICQLWKLYFNVDKLDL